MRHQRATAFRSCAAGCGATGSRDAAAKHRRDLPHLVHQLIELLGIERLLAVAERPVGIGMHFDDQAIGADRNRRARQRRDLVALAGAVAGIDDDRQDG